MHSSRMHTARSLTVSHSIRLWGGGGVCPTPLDADPLPPRQNPPRQTSLDAEPSPQADPLVADPPPHGQKE